MKLTRNVRGYEQLAADETAGGPGLQPDEFAFARDFSEIFFPCRGGKFRNCSVKITTEAQQHPVWHWDGNKEEPTLTPSIGCDGPKRCGWHGSITKGEILP